MTVGFPPPTSVGRRLQAPPPSRAPAAEAADPYEREHVTPFFYRHPERFDLRQFTQAAYEGNLRWTVDTPEDFAAAVVRLGARGA